MMTRPRNPTRIIISFISFCIYYEENASTEFIILYAQKIEIVLCEGKRLLKRRSDYSTMCCSVSVMRRRLGVIFIFNIFFCLALVGGFV